jgi:hypothetical protein
LENEPWRYNQKRSGLGLDVGEAKARSRASKPRKSATKSKSPPKEGAKAKPFMRSRERATGKAASRLIDQRIRDPGGMAWGDPGPHAGALKALVKAAVAQNGPLAKKR